MKWGVAENIVTMISTAALVLGLYAMGAGGWAAAGFILLFNLNTSYQTVPKADDRSPIGIAGAEKNAEAANTSNKTAIHKPVS